MSIVQAAIGSLGAALASQRKSFVTVPSFVTPTPAPLPAVQFARNAGPSTDTNGPASDAGGTTAQGRRSLDTTLEGLQRDLCADAIDQALLDTIGSKAMGSSEMRLLR